MGLGRQVKDEIYLPTCTGADRATAGRVARHLVAGRGGGAASARPVAVAHGRGRLHAPALSALPAVVVGDR